MGPEWNVKAALASEIRGRPIVVQPGNREWMTSIASINAAGWPALPFFVFKAKDHDKAWYHDMPA
jgi:hypothetical protein